MTEPQTAPVKELQAAARKLRETAEPATPGPWGTSPQDGVIAWRLGPGGFDDDYEYVIDDSLVEHNEDASWIALMGPDIAKPLASALDREAEWARRKGAEYFNANGEVANEESADLLAVARAINGTA